MRQTPAAAARKPDVKAIVEEIMEEVRQNAAEPVPVQRNPYIRYASFTILVALCAWIWIAPPAWLVPPPPAPPSAEMREASMRVVLVLHSQRVEAYRRNHGRLPTSAQEIGLGGGEIAYRRVGADAYELSGRVGAVPITFRSATPREEFLGNSMTVLTRARR